MSVANAPLNCIQSIERQHCQIEALLEALESRFDSQETANRSLVSLLNSLATHLQIHFELEEDYYFSKMIPRNSEYSKAGNQLLREHDRMLAAVGDLVEKAREAFSKCLSLDSLKCSFVEFSKQLRAHEAEEEIFFERFLVMVTSSCIRNKVEATK